ncbi:MAG: hypothetical protein Q7U31_12790 [Anaerolineaceae bacterium]|nr:hypothetical protein [Anaerolineaceae bacterium]
MDVKRKSITPSVARVLIGIVTFFNLQCAFFFLFRPADFAPGFELTGVPGAAIIQGMGLLFVMWNVPYLFALVNPLKYTVSLIEAVIMQAVGMFGETILLLLLKGEHPLIKASVLRFIVFDGAGLVLLLIALLLILTFKRTQTRTI